MTKESIGKAFSQMGLQARQQKAAERRAKVKVLKDKGYTAPRIAEELGVKVRLVHQDFSILKREVSECDNG